MTKFSNEVPEIYKRCHDVFGVNWSKGVIITYGDTVYCKFDLPDYKIVHEEVHVVQQASVGPSFWWERYFADPSFRLQEELEAYRAEYKFIHKNVKDRNQKFKMLHEICTDLSGPMYGDIISYDDAIRMIKS